jgi:hypothetical protein
MICNYAVYAAHRPFTDERRGDTTAEDRKREEILFELLSFSPGKFGPQTLTEIALKGA